MSLGGKKILITRSAHQAQEFSRMIRQHGGIPVLFPTIEIIEPKTWDDCDRAIEGLYMYDGIIFISTNGVEFFVKRLKNMGHSPEELKSKMILVVGEKTGLAIEQYGLKVTSMPEKFTSFDLAKKIEQEDLNGKSFLFPRGNLGKDTLADNLKLLGANVDSVVVYQTRQPQQAEVEKVRTMLTEGNIDVATFTSPSTFTNFTAFFPVDELKSLRRIPKIAVIGPVTRRAITASGIEVDIEASESTIENIVSAIELYFTSQML